MVNNESEPWMLPSKDDVCKTPLIFDPVNDSSE
jgi:hypothetical protein